MIAGVSSSTAAPPGATPSNLDRRADRRGASIPLPQYRTAAGQRMVRYWGARRAAPAPSRPHLLDGRRVRHTRRVACPAPSALRRVPLAPSAPPVAARTPAAGRWASRGSAFGGGRCRSNPASSPATASRCRVSSLSRAGVPGAGSGGSAPIAARSAATSGSLKAPTSAASRAPQPARSPASVSGLGPDGLFSRAPFQRAPGQPGKGCVPRFADLAVGR
jgi:hypothetical protein